MYTICSLFAICSSATKKRNFFLYNHKFSPAPGTNLQVGGPFPLDLNQCTVQMLLPRTCNCGLTPMIGNRVQFHEEAWQELRLLAAESMKSFQELADEAFNDLLRKHGRPASLKEALRRSAGQTAKVVAFKRKGRATKGRS